MKLDLVLPGGQRWTSHWHSLSSVISYGRTRVWPSISIEKKFYDLTVPVWGAERARKLYKALLALEHAADMREFGADFAL